MLLTNDYSPLTDFSGAVVQHEFCVLRLGECPDGNREGHDIGSQLTLFESELEYCRSSFCIFCRVREIGSIMLVQKRILKVDSINTTVAWENLQDPVDHGV